MTITRIKETIEEAFCFVYSSGNNDLARDLEKAEIELESIHAEVSNICSRYERDKWHKCYDDSDFPEGNFPAYEPLLIKCINRNGDVKSTYYLVGMYERNAGIWSRAIDHEPIHDNVLAWKYIYD